MSRYVSHLQNELLTAGVDNPGLGIERKGVGRLAAVGIQDDGVTATAVVANFGHLGKYPLVAR